MAAKKNPHYRVDTTSLGDAWVSNRSTYLKMES